MNYRAYNLVLIRFLASVGGKMLITENRKARFDYEIVQTIEAGLVLAGWEVKSIRSKNINLAGAWVKLENGQAWLQQTHISPWKFGEIAKQDPFQPRKLLMHKKELLKLESLVAEKKVTVVPLKIYFQGGKIKCEIGVGKGRKRHEKKQVLKERSVDKEARKALKDL